MDKRSIGEISRGGGFPKAIDTVATTNKSLVITKGGEPIVAMIPCSEATVHYLKHKERLEDLLLLAIGKNIFLPEDIQEYLTYQVSMGSYAKSLLLAMSNESSPSILALNELENKLLASIGKRITDAKPPKSVTSETKGEQLIRLLNLTRDI